MKTQLSRSIMGFFRDPEGLRKLVGGAIGSAAIAIMLMNVITLAHLGMTDPREIAIQNEVLILLVFGIVAFATARWNSRISEWTQVLILFATALLTANEAKPGDLTSALILIFALILPFEYDFGKKSIIVYVFVALVFYSLVLASGYSASSPAYLSQFAGAVLGLFFFVALYGGVALRHRIRLEDEAELLEAKVKERTIELEALLSERVAMLSEIHHRVKNNLQLVASLLQLGAERADGGNIRSSLDAGVRRIYAMAQVHDSLYDTERLDIIDLADYSRRLLETIGQDSTFRFDFSTEGPVLGPLDLAVPFGLILHELAT
ncbi:MAG TPA: sensor histidine kinase, partial [Rectinemataceae bacterium]|nr:sensor histidine kinase [Rectinemataceae bacterium]